MLQQFSANNSKINYCAGTLVWYLRVFSISSLRIGKTLQLSKWNGWGKMELTFFFQGCVCAVDVMCNWWHDDLYKGTNRKRKCFCFSCLPHKQAEASTLYPNQTHPWPQNTEFNSALSGRWCVKKEMLLWKNRNILHTLESILSTIPFVASPWLIHISVITADDIEIYSVKVFCFLWR